MRSTLHPDNDRSINVALLGCGTVGHEIALQLNDRAGELSATVGVPVRLAGIAVRDPQRHSDVSASLLTTDAHALATRPDVDLVIEVMGGLEPAHSAISAALESGRPVVTANKELVATKGPLLQKEAEAGQAELRFEAAVVAAVPLITPLRESLVGDRITTISGILNGTCNYVLSAMHERDHPFDVALQEAIDLGYAEADYAADVEGRDAAAKAAILASLAFNTAITPADVDCEGITNVTAADVQQAREQGGVIKLIATCERPAATGTHTVSVRPTFVSRSHPLAQVSGSMNAVHIDAEFAGPMTFSGQGAGGSATASAILGDVVTAIRNSLGAARQRYAA